MAGFDFTEFQAYRDNFMKMYLGYQKWLNQFLLNQGLKFIRDVKLRTPVDHGDLRQQWALDGITRKGDILEVHFVNPMYYASFVEYGHAKPYKAGAAEGSADWVDGYFMMTVTIDEIERNLPARFDKEFRNYLKGMGLM